MQEATEISLPHHQGSFSDEYFTYYNNRKINIDFNKILHSEINGSLARNKKYDEYFTEATEISLPHHQSMSFSDEYFPCYNNRKINIDFNEILHSEINGSLARNKIYEIQIEYVTEIHMVIPNTIHYASPYPIHHVPQYPIHHVPKHKRRQLMHNKYMLNTFTVLQYFGENGRFYYKQILLMNIGVFSSNTLPSYAQTGYYVVNLDMSQQPGSHWIAIKISKSKCKNEYFDSYRLGPPTVHFKKFMRYNYTYNSKRFNTLFPLLAPSGAYITYGESVKDGA